jgi:hypothetical protein
MNWKTKFVSCIFVVTPISSLGSESNLYGFTCRRCLRTSHTVVRGNSKCLPVRSISWGSVRTHLGYTRHFHLMCFYLCIRNILLRVFFMPRVNLLMRRRLFVELSAGFTLYLNNDFTFRKLQHSRRSLLLRRHFTTNEKQRETTRNRSAVWH